MPEEVSKVINKKTQQKKSSIQVTIEHQERYTSPPGNPKGPSAQVGSCVNVTTATVPTTSITSGTKPPKGQQQKDKQENEPVSCECQVGCISIGEETIDLEGQERISFGSDKEQGKQGFIISKSLDKSSDGKTKSGKINVSAPARKPPPGADDLTISSDTFTTPSSAKRILAERMMRPSLEWGARVSVNVPARRNSEHDVTWIDASESEESETSSESDEYSITLRPSIIVNMDGVRGNRISFTFDKLDQDVKDYLAEVWEEETRSSSMPTNDTTAFEKVDG